MTRPCAVFGCPEQATYRVYYTGKAGESETDCWAKTCRKHAHQAHFPISWGVITSVVPL